MKKVRMILSAAIVFTVVGGALAFKPAKNGAFVCQSTSSTTCSTSDLNYKQGTPGQGSTLFCNDGGTGTSCTNQRNNMVQDD